jgi:hypothetical protein
MAKTCRTIRSFHSPRRASSTRMWAPRLWIAIPLLLAGCAYQLRHTTRAKGDGPLGASYYSSAERIEVVSAEQVADRPYRQVGLVHAPGSMERAEAITTLRLRARAMRGEALLDVRKGSGTTANDAGPSPANAPWQATVIVWTDKQAAGQSGTVPLPAQGTPSPPPPRRR